MRPDLFQHREIILDHGKKAPIIAPPLAGWVVGSVDNASVVAEWRNPGVHQDHRDEVETGADRSYSYRVECRAGCLRVSGLGTVEPVPG